MNQNYLTLLILLFTFSVSASPYENGRDYTGKDSLAVMERDTVTTNKVTKQLNYLQSMAKYHTGVLGTTTKKKTATTKKIFKSFPELEETLVENQSFYKSFQDMSPEFDKKFLESEFAKYFIDWIFACRDESLKQIGITTYTKHKPLSKYPISI